MADPLLLANPLALVTGEMAREVAASQGVCGRPLIRRVLDRDTGTDTQVAIPCGSTRERVCPACAAKARRLRIQQCAEGWHRDTEPERACDHDPDAGDGVDQEDEDDSSSGEAGSRRARSTKRRSDAPDLPRVPVEDRTIGRTYTSPQGREYRPSMFLTLTLPSYGAVRAGAPLDPDTYDYRRAALDAVVFPRLVDRFWQNLRRVAGYRVQYFAAVEPQHRLAPHLHAAIRGTIPRKVIKQVVEATYLQVWWPAFDEPVYVHRKPCWDGHDYCDPDTGELLPTWQEALDQADPDTPAHVARFGAQYDLAGIIAPSKDADRAIRYLTKYLTKSIADAYAPSDDDDLPPDPRYLAHIDRLHDELQFLPCGERCANWLRYGIQPLDAGPGLVAGRCGGKAHDRDHLGLGGRRVLVSRQWSGKTLSEHRADRATVVREALEAAGMLAPEIERMAATVLAKDGKPRFVWTDTRPDATTYVTLVLAAIAEQQCWRAQYQAAKEAADLVDNSSADTGPPP
ncbi:replication initiator [Microlunatus phosphovorus]|uniref:replication initiator n=1 Tax=Microlunatus phosphovorus TaxID=29405 RepID=UPI0002EF0518|nr:replication initiator [Microlunatus phosphovorus]